jgi:hypothetical protein
MQVLALLLTTPAYVQVWREYRAAQLLLNQATWWVIKIKSAIPTEPHLLELQTITHLIREYEQQIIGNAGGICEFCYRGAESLCVEPETIPHNNEELPLSCRQRQLLAAITPQPGDWAYNLLKVSK